MGEGKNKLGLWIALGVIIALLLSCLVGGLAGGVAGYYAGKRGAGVIGAPRAYRALPGHPAPQTETPTPRTPDGSREFESFPWPEASALIMKVVEDSPAQDAGLRPGDMIVEVDGESLVEGKTLAEMISRHEPGDRVELRIVRQGRERTIKVRLGQHPEGEAKTPWLGIEYSTLPRFQFHFESPDSFEGQPEMRN